jgi:hypothetical protein
LTHPTARRVPQLWEATLQIVHAFSGLFA